MEYKGISIDRLNTIQRLRYHRIEPIVIEQKDVMKNLENNDVVMQINGALEKMRMQMLEDTEMSIVIEMAKAYLESMTPHEVKGSENAWRCSVCGIGFGHRFGFDFCPWCGNRMKW